MMKHYSVFLLSFLIFLGACSKNEPAAEINLDEKIFGRWLEKHAGFNSTTLVRVSRFGEYEKGIVIFDDKTMIERSEGGICIGEYCLTDNYYGTYEVIDNHSIKVKVTNFIGPQNYMIKFTNIKTDTLVIEKRY